MLRISDDQRFVAFMGGENLINAIGQDVDLMAQ